MGYKIRCKSCNKIFECKSTCSRACSGRNNDIFPLCIDCYFNKFFRLRD